MTLFQRIGFVAIKIPWRFIYLQQVQTIRDWNYLLDSLISSAEMSDNCMTKFTSLVRACD